MTQNRPFRFKPKTSKNTVVPVVWVDWKRYPVFFFQNRSIFFFWTNMQPMRVRYHTVPYVILSFFFSSHMLHSVVTLNDHTIVLSSSHHTMVPYRYQVRYRRNFRKFRCIERVQLKHVIIRELRNTYPILMLTSNVYMKIYSYLSDIPT